MTRICPNCADEICDEFDVCPTCWLDLRKYDAATEKEREEQIAAVRERQLLKDREKAETEAIKCLKERAKAERDEKRKAELDARVDAWMKERDAKRQAKELCRSQKKSGGFLRFFGKSIIFLSMIMMITTIVLIAVKEITTPLIVTLCVFVFALCMGMLCINQANIRSCHPRLKSEERSSVSDIYLVLERGSYILSVVAIVAVLIVMHEAKSEVQSNLYYESDVVNSVDHSVSVLALIYCAGIAYVGFGMAALWRCVGENMERFCLLLDEKNKLSSKKDKS